MAFMTCLLFSECSPAGIHKSLGVAYNLDWALREESDLGSAARMPLESSEKIKEFAEIFRSRWAVSSEEERLLHEQEVAGSSPAPPTTPKTLKFAQKITK